MGNGLTAEQRESERLDVTSFWALLCSGGRRFGLRGSEKSKYTRLANVERKQENFAEAHILEKYIAKS